MNRTIKFQLSNIKESYLYAALFSYGTLILFNVVALLIDGAEFVSNMTTQPIWLVLVTLFFAPFTILAVFYALFDGLMFFDTSLRFGVSRKSYFMTQLITYVFLTLMLAIGNGLTEVAWTGTTATFFSQIATEYLTIGNLASEFILTLGLGIIMLAVYRFKVKALIPVVFIGPLFGIFIGASFSISENTFLVDRMIDVAEFIMNNPELSAGILIAAMIGIYYLFITKTEVQD